MTKGRCIEGCGSCCVPVLLAFTQEQVRWMVPYESSLPPTQPNEQRVDKRTRRWVLKELTPITWAAAEKLRPDLIGRRPATRLADGSYSESHAYLCKWFDYDTRRCTNYEDRPNTCRDWPPSDGGQAPPGMEVGLPPTCGFWPDYGREPEPLPERWQPVIMLEMKK